MLLIILFFQKQLLAATPTSAIRKKIIRFFGNLMSRINEKKIIIYNE
jgi:hypothetical protein